jgi:hypothetical protein
LSLVVAVVVKQEALETVVQEGAVLVAIELEPHHLIQPCLMLLL